MSVLKFSRSFTVANGNSQIQALPAGADPYLVSVNPSGGATGDVDFSLSDDFVSIQKRQRPVVGGVINGGTNFTVDLSADPVHNLTTDVFDGLAVAIETGTQTKIFATINDITAGIWDLEEILSGEAFSTEPGATVTLYLAAGAPASVLDEGIKGALTDVPGVKTNGLLATWVNWSEGAVTVLTAAALDGSPTALRFTTTVAGSCVYEVVGTEIGG